MIELPIIGCHAFVALEGEEIDSITVSATAKPDGDPEANWTSLGVIEQAGQSVSYEGETTHYAPSPGGYKQRRSTFEAVNVAIALTCQDMGEFIFALAMGSKQPNGTGDYTPGDQTEKQRGWLKVQQYRADTDELVNIFDVWCEFTVSETTSSRQVTKPVLNCAVLSSTLNVGKLSNISS
ncbi:MAG: hypothetical protein ACQKBU_04495 [Verrucomicrobiales bacterium]